jgi:DNA-binding transcriptional ArsR family regulator
MARAHADADVFSALAEPRRREIIGLLGRGEAGEGRPVTELVREMGLAQPAVSKHLGVLLKVGLVSVSREGRMRVYRLEGAGLKTVHDWISGYERFWGRQADRIKARAERLARERGRAASDHPKTTEKHP